MDLHPTVVVNQRKDGATKYTIDFNAEAVRIGTTVSTTVWSVESGNATVSSTDNLADNVVTGLVTTSDTGVSNIKILITLADGQIVPQWLKVVAKDEYEYTTDYHNHV